MAEVVPFRGVRYNTELIPDMSAVVAPPYDVISPDEQEVYYKRHPNNVINLILGKRHPGDTATDNMHTRAGLYFRTWMAQNILVLDPVPAFYLTRVEFSTHGTQYARYGIIGCVRLEPFEKGIVLPHEHTFSKVKSERLMLMKECHANFSPIFGLYTGGSELMDRLNAITGKQAPDVDVVDDKKHRHKLWRLTEPEIVAYMVSFFENKKLYIADGHHRYETALNYRNWVKVNQPGFSSEHPANFIMMSLSSMIDPGLIILPAHRLLKKVSTQVVTALVQKAQEFFNITSIGMDQGMDAALAEFDRTLQSKSQKHAIGLFSHQPSILQIMTLKEGVMDRLYKDQIAHALRDLDVTILTHMILMELMGFDQERLDDETQIGYHTTINDAVRAVNEGEAVLAFILNSTKIEQVRRVAEHGLTMPRKSTYFYPKAISGLVFNLLR